MRRAKRVSAVKREVTALKIEISGYNKQYLTDVKPEDLIINDTTLREGEQAANVNFNLDQKMEVARKLDEVGIHQMQGGYPGRSEIDKKFIQTVKKAGLRIKTEALVQIFTPDWKEQIDAAVESGADVLGLMHPSSDLRLDYQKMERSDMLERCIKAIEYGRGKLPVLRFSTTDTTRTDMDFLKEVYGAAIESGADRILIADTAGCALPEAIYALVKEIVDTFTVPVQIHCHNDFGLALPNTLAAVRAGATIIDVSINGLGERSGNTSLAEVVAVLKFLYQKDIPIKAEEMYSLSRLVERISGVIIPDDKPLIGNNAFAHKLDAHVKGMYYNSALYETISPELVGNSRRIPIGKYSGPFIIGEKLKELGITATAQQIKQIVLKTEQLSIEKRRSLTNDELIGIANQVKQTN
jgi:methanogen homocitrate synthase